jgi:hypothetical protein
MSGRRKPSATGAKKVSSTKSRLRQLVNEGFTWESDWSPSQRVEDQLTRWNLDERSRSRLRAAIYWLEAELAAYTEVRHRGRQSSWLADYWGFAWQTGKRGRPPELPSIEAFVQWCVAILSDAKGLDIPIMIAELEVAMAGGDSGATQGVVESVRRWMRRKKATAAQSIARGRQLEEDFLASHPDWDLP